MKQGLFLVLTSLLFAFPSCNKNKVTKIPLPDGAIENDWNKAISAAQDNDRPIFVHFYADWCRLCADFKEEVLNEPEVEAYMLANFVNATLDSEKEPGKAIYESFGLSGHPNLVVTDKNGNKIGEHLKYLKQKILLFLTR